MEIIIFVAVVVVAALLWNGYIKTRKAESDQTIDHWEPPKELVSTEKEWPFGEKLLEGKIHVKVSGVAPVQSADDRVEAPALTVDGHGDVHEVKPGKKASAPGKSADDRVEAPAPVVEPAPAKKPVAKKTAAKPAVAKKAPAKKKST